MYLTAHAVELFRNRIRNRAADAAADNRNFLQSLQMGRSTERSHKILNIIAGLFVVQLCRCSSDNLINNRNDPFFPVIIRYRQRDPLAVLIHAQDDKLTGFCFPGNMGSLDIHQGHRRIQLSFS